jgi:energy-coupling factor transport system permease protein
MTFARRSSPLHAAHAVIGALWCLAIVTVTLSVHHPLVLGVLIAAVAAAGFAARVGRPVLIGIAFGIPFGLTVVLMNALTTREGLTVIYRLGGPWDITLEAVVQGGVYALLAIALFAVARLYSAGVDPDDLLRAFRRLSFQSALTAALATRLVPVLARDARRLHDAARCRAGEPPSRIVLVRALAAGTMDRAIDVAATLETRGYGHGGRAPALRRAWSRHDLAFGLSALALFALAIVGRGAAPFDAYPSLSTSVDGGVWATCAALVVVVLAPFADRRGT